MTAILIYCALLIGIGYWFRRESRDPIGYFLAGRGLGGVQMGLSLAASGFGGSAILIASQLSYQHGLAGICFSGSVGLGFLVLGLAFARRMRASGAHSLAHYLGMHYGEAVRRLVSLLIVVVEIGFFGLTVKSFSLLTTPLLGTAWWPAGSEALFQALVCAVFVLYTLLGGQKADVITDLIQLFLIAAVMLLLLLPVSLGRADLTTLPEGFLALPFGPGAGLPFVLNMLVLMMLPAIAGGDVFTKILSTQSTEAARTGAILAGVTRLGLALVVTILALCARVLLPDLSQPALAIPLLARELLPPPIFHLVAFAFLSILLSVGDSVLITASTLLTLDVLRLGERVSMPLVRLITLSIALAGLGLAIWFGGVLEVMKFAYTLLTAAVMMPVIVTLAFPSRLPSRGFLVAGIIAGLVGVAVSICVSRLFPSMAASVDAATVGTAASGVVMMAGVLISTHGIKPSSFIA